LNDRYPDLIEQIDMNASDEGVAIAAEIVDNGDVDPETLREAAEFERAGNEAMRKAGEAAPLP